MSKEQKEMPTESSGLVNRRAFLQATASALTGAAVPGGFPEIAAARKAPGSSHANASKEQSRSGHLYMQTNETRNVIVQYHRSANGKLTEVARLSTGGGR